MPKESKSDPRKNFVPRYMPWLLGGVMFAVYWVTLNHWVTLANLAQVATVSGFVWQAQLFNPLTYLATLPFRWLPAAHIPLALNVFSAVCGAATLAVLARTVAILPHDRTDMERNRERGDFSFLTGWVAWAPPVAAVLYAGLQLAFWKNATSFTGESFELLWFAVILWQLLEYRLDEREVRLYAAALLYGAGITENWAMVGFFPLFLMMLVWLRKLDFFHINFLTRMTLCGLAGLLLILLMPLVARFSAPYPMTIWAGVRANLRSDWLVLESIQDGTVRYTVAVMSLTSLLPAFLMAIRWSSGFGDSSRMGAMLVNYLMYLVNAAFLCVLVWVSFDPPFSPHQLLPQLSNSPPPGLTFYYLTALCLGYFCGFFLLIFGKPPVPTRRNPRPLSALPRGLRWLCPVIVATMLAGVAWGAVLLVYKNAPVIRALNDDSLLKYAQFAAQTLPREGAIILCDSDNPNGDQPIRAYLLRAELEREGRPEKYPVVDTKSLNWSFYHNYLHKSYPQSWPQTVATNEAGGLSPLRIFLLLNQFSKSNNLCYLNPSFGYYFENFFQEPHGLIYLLKQLPKDAVLPPPLDKNLMAENESFWARVLDSTRPAIETALNPPDITMPNDIFGWFMMHLHPHAEANPNALLAGEIYSRSLNYLGVQVQRAGELNSAADLFTNAVALNPRNVVAGVNLGFNRTLRDHRPTGVNLSRITADQFGESHNWDEVLSANGPYDETSFCFDTGTMLMQGGLMRQAAVPFNRVRQLAPDNLAARLYLAQIYIYSRLPDKAMEELHDPLTTPARFALNEYNATELNVLAAAAHFQRNENADGAALLESEIARHPDDETLMLVSAQSFNMRGMYTNALHVINRKLARVPDDPQWLYGKGIVCLQLHDYAGAVTALSRIIELQTNNPDALFNRGFAYYQSDRLNDARADFLQLQAAYTNSFQVAFGLGEIARRQHETNEAIRNYRIYLANAPTNYVEIKSVREHLVQLGGQ
jgi:tetratricopeptide (TPR) repeat protein